MWTMAMRSNTVEFDGYSGTCAFFDIRTTCQEQRFNVIPSNA